MNQFFHAEHPSQCLHGAYSGSASDRLWTVMRC